MTDSCRKEIDKLNQITYDLVLGKKYSPAFEGFDKLSILYMSEFIHYSELMGTKESSEEKREISKGLSSLLEEWRAITDLRKRVLEKDKEESIHVARINFQIAILQKNFPLADERERILSGLYLEGITLYSEHICELEEMISDTINPFKKEQFKENIKLIREAYTEMNTDWIEIQTARKLYSE